MATIYICKCGRRVSKSTNADNTGNRDTENCKGCPYLLPWGPFEHVPGQGFVRNVQGYECRMSPEISYATDYSGGADDKRTMAIHSLDLDFLEEVQAWIDEYADGQLSGRFSRDTIRGTDYCNEGRYSWSISCAQNKKGMAAKGALIERFFGPDKHRLDKTPEEEKAIVLAAIEAGKAKAQERKESMEYTISKHVATGRLYAYYKGSLWFWDEHVQKWLLSQFAENLYQEHRKSSRDFTREDLLAQTADFYLLDDYEVSPNCIETLLQCNPKTAERENPTNAAEDVQQCAHTASDAPLSQSQSVNAGAQQDGGDDSGEPTSAVGELIPTGTENRRQVPSYAMVRCGEVEVFHVCRQKPENAKIWLNAMMPAEYWVKNNPGDVCGEHIEICPYCKANLKNGEGDVLIVPFGYSENFTDAAPVSPADAGAATQNLSGAEPASLEAPPSGSLAFDYSGLDDQTVADLHLAEREYSSGKKMAEMGLRRMADAVAIAHDTLCGAVVHMVDNSKHGNRGEDTFRCWCESIGVGKTTAYKMLQVSKLMDDSSPREQKVLEELSPSLLYAAAKPSAPAELVQAVKDGDITTHKQFRELEAQLKAEREARVKAQQDLETVERARDAEHEANSALLADEQRRRQAADEARIAAENKVQQYREIKDAALENVKAEREKTAEAERRARAAEEDAAGWKQAGLEMQEIVDDQQAVIEEQKIRIGELESGITVEAAAVDQEEIERRANELSEPLVKIIDQQNEQIERMAFGNTVAAQASVLEQYLETMKTSLLGNARRAELACYDVGALDSLAQALREFADEIDELFERGEENEE